jgi:hypothetical protein
MWLLGRLAPDFKTIADFREDNTKAIRKVCREFVMIWVLCTFARKYTLRLYSIYNPLFLMIHKNCFQ